MSWLLPPLPPNWPAAVRDVQAKTSAARVAAATRLGRPESGAEDVALSGLTLLVEDVDSRVRAAAVEALGELGDPRSVTHLVSRLEDVSAQVRELAVVALGMLPAAVSGEALLRATSHEHPELRFQAVRLVAELLPEHASAPILRLLADDDVHVRQSAVQALSSLPPETLSDALVRAADERLRDSDATVRGGAAVVLAGLGHGSAARALGDALDDPQLVFAALEVAPSLEDPALRERIATLAQRVLAPRVLVAAAARALGRMGDPRAIPIVRGLLTGLRTSGREAAVEIAGELRLTALSAELARLAERPRGVSAPNLVQSLGLLARDAPDCAAALHALTARRDAFGAAARAALEGGTDERREPTASRGQ